MNKKRLKELMEVCKGIIGCDIPFTEQDKDILEILHDTIKAILEDS